MTKYMRTTLKVFISVWLLVVFPLNAVLWHYMSPMASVAASLWGLALVPWFSMWIAAIPYKRSHAKFLREMAEHKKRAG